MAVGCPGIKKEKNLTLRETDSISSLTADSLGKGVIQSNNGDCNYTRLKF